MNTWMDTLLIASRDAGILALAIGSLLLVAGRRIPAGWRHGLWLLVAVRLLMPTLPTSAVSWQHLLETEKPAAPLSQNFPPSEIQRLNPPSLEHPHSSPLGRLEAPERYTNLTVQPPKLLTKFNILFVVWISGMAGLLGFGIFLTWRFSRQLRKLGTPFHEKSALLGDLLETLGNEAGWWRLPRLRITEAVEVPALFGLFRPVILMPPATLDRLSENELRLVLLHELGHWRRRDLWVNFALAVVQAIHWFNPLVWWSFHRTRVESERATDAWVLRRAGVGHVACYGEMLLRLLDQNIKPRTVFSGIVSVVESPQDLRRRILGIGRFTGKSNRLAAIGSVAILLGLAAVGLTQPPAPAKEPKEMVKDRIIQAEDMFTCRVVTSEGNPAEGAEVFSQAISNLDGQNIDPLTSGGKTDEAGVCRIPIKSKWLESTYTTIHLFVSHFTNGHGAISVGLPIAKSGYEISLAKGSGLRFHIRDENGMAIPQLQLRVVKAQFPILKDDRSGKNRPRFWGDVPPMPKGFWEGVTDDQGRCAIENLAPGLYYVDHDEKKYGQVPGHYHQGFQYNPATQDGEIELTLPPAASVAGTARLPDGTPVAGASVMILEQQAYRKGGVTAKATTDANGRYQLDRLLEADYNLSVDLGNELDRGWIAEIAEISLTTGERREQLDPRFTKGALVSGKVTLADTGVGVADLAIGLSLASGSSSLASTTAMTDKNGVYQARTKPGKTTVYVAGLVPEGYTRETSDRKGTSIELVVENGVSYTADFAIPRESQISGVVVNPSGEPVGGARVSCLEPNDRMGDPINVVSDPAGKFSITLPAGTQKARLMADFDGMVTTYGIMFPVTDMAKLELKVNEFGSASGRVVDTEGKPIAGALVTNNGETIDDERVKLITDAEGRYKTKRLLPDKQIIFYGSKAGYGRVSSHAAFKAGQSVDLEPIVLPKADAMVSGKVVDPAGNPVSGASVEASGYLQPEGVEILTDAEGNFVLRGVVAGWLDVQVIKRMKNDAFRMREVRVRTGKAGLVIQLPDESSVWKPEVSVDHIGKQAPPLKAVTWFHTDPLPEQQPGKVRLLEFVGLNRPLIFFRDTLSLLQKLREEIPGQELEIIVVHGAWPQEEVTEILASDYPDFKIPLAIEPEEGAMSKAFGAQSWLTVVIDREGKVAFQSLGEWGKAKKKVRELLGKK